MTTFSDERLKNCRIRTTVKSVKSTIVAWLGFIEACRHNSAIIQTKTSNMKNENGQNHKRTMNRYKTILKLKQKWNKRIYKHPQSSFIRIKSSHFTILSRHNKTQQLYVGTVLSAFGLRYKRIKPSYDLIFNDAYKIGMDFF